MKSEPPNPNIESYNRLWMARLKDYIASKGGINRAALRLHVHPGTLEKIINNMEVSWPTRRKIANIIKANTPIAVSQLDSLDKPGMLSDLESFVNAQQHTASSQGRPEIGIIPTFVIPSATGTNNPVCPPNEIVPLVHTILA